MIKPPTRVVRAGAFPAEALELIDEIESVLAGHELRVVRNALVNLLAKSIALTSGNIDDAREHLAQLASAMTTAIELNFVELDGEVH